MLRAFLCGLVSSGVLIAAGHGEEPKKRERKGEVEILRELGAPGVATKILGDMVGVANAGMPLMIPDDHPRLAQFIKRGIVRRAPARSWGCEQASGPPDTEGAGDIVTAWASATQDGQDEWLELTYKNAVKPVEVHVIETYNPGALFKVTAVTESGMEAVLWKGQDPTPKDAAERRGTSIVKVTAALKTNRIRIHLASKDVPGWNEIDAVGIKDATGKMHWAKSVTASSNYAGGPAPGWILDPAAALKYIDELEAEIERLKSK